MVGMWQERDFGTHLQVKRHFKWNATSLLAAFIKGLESAFCGMRTVMFNRKPTRQTMWTRSLNGQAATSIYARSGPFLGPVVATELIAL
jgi:hypothetical protein